MKIQRSKSKSGLFLIELIIAIVFFAVASAVCIQLFVHAYLISERSEDLSTASMIAQNYAEEYKTQPFQQKRDAWQKRNETSFQSLYGYNGAGDLVPLTDDQAEQAEYALRATVKDDDSTVFTTRILVSRWDGEFPENDEDALYVLEVMSYEPENIVFANSN